MDTFAASRDPNSLGRGEHQGGALGPWSIESLSAESLSAESLSAESLSAESLSAESLSAESLSAESLSAGRPFLGMWRNWQTR
jgi:hypothetical protein